MTRSHESTEGPDERLRLAAGVVALLAGAAFVLLPGATTAPPGPLGLGALLVGVALLVAGTLAIGTSEPRRSA